MESQKIPILLNRVAAFLGALVQYAYKKGGLRFSATGKLLIILGLTFISQGIKA